MLFAWSRSLPSSLSKDNLEMMLMFTEPAAERISSSQWCINENHSISPRQIIVVKNWARRSCSKAMAREDLLWLSACKPLRNFKGGVIEIKCLTLAHNTLDRNRARTHNLWFMSPALICLTTFWRHMPGWYKHWWIHSSSIACAYIESCADPLEPTCPDDISMLQRCGGSR